jgi:hypothetical protein
MVVNNMEEAIKKYGFLIQTCAQFKDIKIVNQDNIIKAFESCAGSTWLTEIALEMLKRGIIESKQ